MCGVCVCVRERESVCMRVSECMCARDLWTRRLSLTGFFFCCFRGTCSRMPSSIRPSPSPREKTVWTEKRKTAAALEEFRV